MKGLKGAIEFRNVTFTHRGAARPSLEEIFLAYYEADRNHIQ